MGQLSCIHPSNRSAVDQAELRINVNESLIYFGHDEIGFSVAPIVCFSETASFIATSYQFEGLASLFIWIKERSVLKFFECFAKDKTGTTAIEYGLIGTLISVSIIAGAMTLGNTVGNQFQGLADKMNNAQNAHK